MAARCSSVSGVSTRPSSASFFLRRSIASSYADFIERRIQKIVDRRQNGEHRKMLSEEEVLAAVGEEGFTRLVAAFYRQIPGDEILGPMYRMAEAGTPGTDAERDRKSGV